jgi:hypothetical protein
MAPSVGWEYNRLKAITKAEANPEQRGVRGKECRPDAQSLFREVVCGTDGHGLLATNMRRRHALTLLSASIPNPPREARHYLASGHNERNDHM